VAKHFNLTITDDRFDFARDAESIEAESKLDGIYVIRTNVAADKLGASEVVQAYKGLSLAERAFRSYKTVDLEVRPIHHRLPRSRPCPRAALYAFILPRMADAPSACAGVV
jgi:hypothetical protein